MWDIRLRVAIIRVIAIASRKRVVEVIDDIEGVLVGRDSEE